MKIKVIISGLVILILVSLTCLTTTVTTSTILKQGDSRTYYFKGNFGTTNATFNIDGTPSEILIHNGTTFTVTICNVTQEFGIISIATQSTINNQTTTCSFYDSYTLDTPFSYRIDSFAGTNANKSFYNAPYYTGWKCILNANNWTYTYNFTRQNYKYFISGSIDISTGWYLSQEEEIYTNNGTDINIGVYQINPIKTSPGFETFSIISILIISSVIMKFDKRKKS